MQHRGNHLIWRNQRGNTLLTVLMLTAAVSIGFFFLSDQVVMQKKQIEKNASTLQLRMGLHSAIDYVLFGLKQRWCFNETLLPDMDCNLIHNASVERLLMSSQQESFIRDLIAKGLPVGPIPSGSLQLSGFHIAVPISALTNKHPLFTIISRIKTEELKYVVIDVNRDTNAALPTSGREVYLRINVALSSSESGTPLMYGTYPLTVSSFVSIHPREVGSFAMVVAGNLRLDKQWNEASPRGDVQFGKLANKASLGASTGLIFESPVFVNRDIHLPHSASSDRKTADSVYSPVTFADRIYMGDGRIYENGQPYAPASPGAPGDQYWTDNKLFGGFMRGLENDGARDAGLDFVGLLETGTVVDTSLAQKCTIYNLSRADKNFIKKSELRAEPLKITSTSARYRFDLNYDIEFSPQKNNANAIATSGKPWLGAAPSRTIGSVSQKPILEIEGNFDGQIVQAQMTPDSQLTLKPKIYASKNETTLKKELDDTKKELQDAEAAFTKAKQDLPQLETKLDDVLEDLDKEQNKSPKNQSKINSLKNQRDTLKASIASTKNIINESPSKISDLNQQIAELQNDLADLQESSGSPAEIVVKTIPVEFNGKAQPHLVEISFEFKNVKNLKTKSGTRVDPRFRVKAYDATFYNSNPDPTWVNSKLNAYVNFSNLGNSIGSPDGLSANAGTGPYVRSSTSVTDLSTLSEQCNTLANATSGSAFGAAAWDYSFAASSRASWNFAQDQNSTNVVHNDPLIERLVFDDGNARPGVAQFQVRSIVRECLVRSTATFITGFFTCDQLIIESRTQPLRIIGTFIVSHASIDPSALIAGIRWSSIYAPQALPELRAAGVLRTPSGGACGTSNTPIWHPVPSMVETATRYSCSPISLRAKANPFTWTTVDPDCGYIGLAPVTSCKRRLVRYFVVEQSRESGL